MQNLSQEAQDMTSNNKVFSQCWSVDSQEGGRNACIVHAVTCLHTAGLAMAILLSYMSPKQCISTDYPGITQMLLINQEVGDLKTVNVLKFAFQQSYLAVNPKVGFILSKFTAMRFHCSTGTQYYV